MKTPTSILWPSYLTYEETNYEKKLEEDKNHPMNETINNAKYIEIY